MARSCYTLNKKQRKEFKQLFGVGEVPELVGFRGEMVPMEVIMENWEEFMGEGYFITQMKKKKGIFKVQCERRVLKKKGKSQRLVESEKFFKEMEKAYAKVEDLPAPKQTRDDLSEIDMEAEEAEEAEFKAQQERMRAWSQKHGWRAKMRARLADPIYQANAKVNKAIKEHWDEC